MRQILTYTLLFSILGGPVLAAGSGSPSPAPIQRDKDSLHLKNVEISRDGRVLGQFLTPEGAPLADKTLNVVIGVVKQKVVTDKKGRFIIRNAKGGHCVITAGDHVFACRLWVHGTAPDGALKSIAVIDATSTAVRGNPFSATAARLSALSTAQKIALGLLVTAGTTVAIIEAVDDGS